MSQFNQMNPLLYQQQMIHNMQYRQPPQQFQRYRNKGGDQNDKKDEKSDSSQSAQVSHDEATLKSQLDFIIKLEQEQSGFNPNMTKEQEKHELHAKL